MCIKGDTIERINITYIPLVCVLTTKKKSTMADNKNNTNDSPMSPPPSPASDVEDRTGSIDATIEPELLNGTCRKKMKLKPNFYLLF